MKFSTEYALEFLIHHLVEEINDFFFKFLF